MLHSVQTWLSSLPPGYLYLLVALLIAVESMGVPLPGEIALVSAALLASSGYASIGWVVAAGCLGAIVGDSIGYLIGHRGGRPFLRRLGRRFPNHLGPDQLRRAERIFQRYGVWAIFFGRFVALLRVLAGPLSGALRIPWRKFFVANASGGIIWAGGTALAVYFVGKAAEQWLSRFSWIALIVAVLGGVVTTMIIRNRIKHSDAGDMELSAAAEPIDAPRAK